MRVSAHEWLWLLRGHLRHGVLELPPPGSTWFSAARRALVVATFFAAGLATDTLHLTILAAFGALQVGLMEAVRPGRQFAGVLGLSVVFISVTAFAASALGGTWWVLPLVAGLGYVYGCVGGLGFGPLTVSLGALALGIIFAGIPQSPREAAIGGVWVALGGLTQMSVWLLDLRHERHTYVRRVLAIKVESLAAIARGGVVNQHVVERSFAATDRARAVLATAGLPPAEHAAFEALLAAQLHTMRAMLTWLVLRQPGLQPRMLVAMHLEAIASSVKSGRPMSAQWSTPSAAIRLEDDPPWLATLALGHTLDHVVQVTGALAHGRGRMGAGDVSGVSPLAQTEAAEIPILGGLGAEPEPIRWRTLLAALRPTSTGATFGFRMAVALAVAESMTILVLIGHSFWLPLTVAFILRPDVVNTLFRGLTRFVGNLAAVIVVPTVLVLATGHNAVLVAIVLVLAAITYRYFTGNYALTSFGLAGTVLVLDTTLTPDQNLFFTRVVATAVGAVLALAVVLLMPVRTGQDGGARLAAVTAAFGGWASAVCAGLRNPTGHDRMGLARSLAASRAELVGLGSAAETALFDPHTRGQGVELVVALDAAWRLEITLVALSFYTRVLQEAHAAGLPTQRWCAAIARHLERAAEAGVVVPGQGSGRQPSGGGAQSHGGAQGGGVEVGSGAAHPVAAVQLGAAEAHAVGNQLSHLETGVRDLVAVAARP